MYCKVLDGFGECHSAQLRIDNHLTILPLVEIRARGYLRGTSRTNHPSASLYFPSHLTQGLQPPVSHSRKIERIHCEKVFHPRQHLEHLRVYLSVGNTNHRDGDRGFANRIDSAIRSSADSLKEISLESTAHSHRTPVQKA